MKYITTFLSSLLTVFLLSAQQPVWQALDRPWGINPISAVINSLGHIFVADYEGLYRSMDGGLHWESLGAWLDDVGYISHLEQTSDGTVFALASNNMYAIRLGSSLVEIVPLPDDPDYFTTDPEGSVFMIEAFGTIYRSMDGGRTFKTFLDGSKTDGWPSAMYFFGDGQNFLVSAYGASGYFWRISDDGTMVERILLPGAPHSLSMLRHPSGKLFLWTVLGETYTSADGKIWTKFKIIPSASVQNVQRMFCDPAGKLYALNQGLWYESSDEGNTWVKSAFDRQGISFIQYAPNGSLSVMGTSCSEGRTLLLSRDNWATSEVLEDRFKQSSVSSIQKDGKGRLYAQTCTNYLVSEDDGKSWLRRTIHGSTVEQLFFTRSGRGFARIKTDTVWYISYDGGDNWQRKAGMPADKDSIQYLREDASGNLYGWGDALVFKSTDFGESWIVLGASPTTFKGKLWPHPGGDLYMTGFNILRSSDDGKTWSTLDFLNGAFYDVISFTITNQGLILVTARNGIASNYGAYVSSDGGRSFQIIPPPSSSSAPIYAFYANETGDVFGETGTDLLVSRDRCKTWTSIGKGLPAGDINGFYCDAQNHLYISLYYNTIYKTQQPVSFPNLIRGRVFSDDNANCKSDPGESVRPFQVLKAQGGITRLNAAGWDGAFVMDVPDGQYKVSAVAPGPLWESCPPVSVNFATGQADSARVEVGLKPLARCADLSISLSTSFLRRCFSNTYYIRVANEGTAPASGVAVTLTLDSLMQYEAASLPPRSQQGQVLTFDLGDLPEGAHQGFQVQVKVDCAAELGQLHCVSAQVTPLPNCPIALPLYHATQECRHNQGAFDPNDKQAFAGGLPVADRVAPNTELEYLIRFQNTGTDTAFTVVVSDRLSPRLDLQSIRPGISSHPYRLEILEDRTLRFVFERIALPDSSANEPASHGFVKFSVKPAANLPQGSKIANAANIYFDFNIPVRTNTVDFRVELPTGAEEPTPALHCFIWPNPAKEAFTVQWDRSERRRDEVFQLELFDATGRTVLRRQVSGAQAQVPRDGLPAGLYWLKLTAPDGAFAGARVALD